MLCLGVSTKCDAIYIYIYDNLESAMSKSMIIGGGEELDSSVVDDSEKSGLLKRWLFLGGRAERR